MMFNPLSLTVKEVLQISFSFTKCQNPPLYHHINTNITYINCLLPQETAVCIYNKIVVIMIIKIIGLIIIISYNNMLYYSSIDCKHTIIM